MPGTRAEGLDDDDGGWNATRAGAVGLRMDDANLTSRVERCLRDADPDLANMWRECVSMYGVRSAAARGCLLALVRDAWGDPELSAQGGEHTGWVVCLGSDRGDAEVVGRGNSETDALLCAMESAPS